MVLDRFWNPVDANRAYRRMLGLLLRGARRRRWSRRRPRQPDADGVRPGRVVAVDRECAPCRRYPLRRVWQELQVQAHDRTAREIFQRIAVWHPDMVGPGGVPLFDDEAGEGVPPPVLPVVVAGPGIHASLFSTLTTLGIPQDVRLQELRIECFFPADRACRRSRALAQSAPA